MDEFDAYDHGAPLRQRYIKVGDLSEGSYGMVLVANDTMANRIVAVKFIYPVNYKKSPPGGGRTLLLPAKLPQTTKGQLVLEVKRHLLAIAAKEIAIHHRLGTHPNITCLYDHFDSFLVMEYCLHGDLYEAIQNGTGPALSHDIKDVFNQILSAVEFCHLHLVYHRDLKPENILIADDWLIKLCDWGLATTERIITNRDEFDVGLERYMAPELFDQDITEYDALKIDLWLVGIILLTLVFHKNPFLAANYSDKRFIQFSSNREALFDFFSTMLGEMFAVLRHSLNIDPLNRDLGLLKQELDTLKYFTIDEEYWGDNDLDIEDELELDEEAVFSPQGLPLKTDATLKLVAISDTDKQLPEFSVLPPKLLSLSDDSEMPHNRRADALLLLLTNLKPIPIGGKFVRNTRKPFTVALYNQNGLYMKSLRNRDFNREDFFTPKLVFNHYLDKYGEQQQQDNRKPRKYSHLTQGQGRGRQYWQKKRKARTWKKPKKKASNRLWRFNNRLELNNQAHLQGEHLDRTHNRRKLYSAATTRPQKPANGKYVPPLMRLPMPKPVTDLVAEMERVALHDEREELDEVFHLDDDFDFGEGFDPTDAGTDAVCAGHRRQQLDDQRGKYVPPFRRGLIGGTARPKVRQPVAVPLTLVPLHDYWPRKDWSDYD